MTVEIYKITRRETGQSYIGLSANSRKRRNTHWWIANKKHPVLFQLIHRAIAKHGRDAFDFEVIASALDYPSALVLEVDLIQQWSTHVSKGGYNLTLGGEGKLGRKHSAETRGKISASLVGRKGRPITDVEKAASRARFLALNPEQKAEYARRGVEARIRNGNNTGRKNSPETISRMKAAAIARWQRQRTTKEQSP